MSNKPSFLSDSPETRRQALAWAESPPPGAQVLRVTRFLHDGRSVLTRIADTTKAAGGAIAEAALEVAAGGSGDGDGGESERREDRRTPGCALSWLDGSGGLLRKLEVHPLQPDFEDAVLGQAIAHVPATWCGVELLAFYRPERAKGPLTAGAVERWTPERPAGELLWPKLAREESHSAQAHPQSTRPKETPSPANDAREALCELVRSQGGRVTEARNGSLVLDVSDGKALSSRLWALFSLVVYAICFSLLIWIALPILLLSSKARKNLFEQLRALLLGESLRYEYRISEGRFQATSRQRSATLRMKVREGVSFDWGPNTAVSFAPRAVEWTKPEPKLRVLTRGTLCEVPIPSEAVGAALRQLLVSGTSSEASSPVESQGNAA